MANSAQARKRARQAEKHHKLNASRRSTMRTYINKTRYAVEAGKPDEAKAQAKKAFVMLDRLAGSGLVHPNKAARLKSRMNILLRKMTGQ